jgi:hypothetical protein
MPGSPEELGRQQRRHLPGRREGQLAVAHHHRGESPEVVVVRVVARRVHAEGRVLVADVALVGVDGVVVGLHGVGVAADTDVDVARHVDEVPRPRHEPGEALGAGDGALGVELLDGVDEEVAAARVVRVLRDDGLEVGEGLGDPRIGAAVRRPVIPGPQVHERLRVEHRDLVVVREASGECGHGIGVRLVEVLAVGGRGALVARRQGLDEPPLARARVIHLRQRALQRGVGGERRRLVHRQVDVRAPGQRFAPPAHRASGIEALRLAEGPHALGVVEGVVEAQPLVEVGLRLGDARGDGVVVIAEVGVEGHRRALYRGGRRVVARPVRGMRVRLLAGLCGGGPAEDHGRHRQNHEGTVKPVTDHRVLPSHRGERAGRRRLVGRRRSISWEEYDETLV